MNLTIATNIPSSTAGVLECVDSTHLKVEVGKIPSFAKLNTQHVYQKLFTQE